MSKKRKIIIAVFSLIICFTVGITSAFLISSHKKINRFKIGSNTINITENFKVPDNINKGDVITKDIKVKNTGSKSYIRIFVAVSDDALAKKFDINFNTTDWTKSSDGYYYYNKSLNEGESTTSLFNKLTFKEDLTEKMEIICYSESVQVQGYSSSKEAFNSIK